MRKLLSVIASLLLVLSVDAQINYTHTLPSIQGSQLNSWVEFTFPNTTAPTGGSATLSFGWLACWQQVFGGSSKIWIEIETAPDVWTQEYYETGNVTECVMFNRTASISNGVLVNAIATNGGNVVGRVRVQDSCYPGVGCSSFNDPVVSGLTLEYTAHAASFSVDDASVCPGSSVQFTDASLGSPSSYAWYFEGGVPSTSTDTNPLVYYPNAGNWDVALTVVTTNGPDELILPNYVTVNFPPTAIAGADADVCIGNSYQLQGFGGVSHQWSPPTGLSNPGVANPMATVTESITYTLVVTDANGCQGMDSMMITLHDLPTVIATADDFTLCPGDTATLSAEGASNYQWSPNLFISSNTGATVQAWPTSDFFWGVYGTDAFGCAHDTLIAIDVLAPPTAPTATNMGMTVSSTPADGYQWYVDGELIPGATDQVWAPVVNGNYSVVITDANGCQSQSLPVYFGTVGVSAGDIPAWSVYPQPADDEMMVTNVRAGSELRLFDASGRVVSLTKVNTSGTARLDVSQLVSGSYLLELRDGAARMRMTVLVR